MSHEFRNGGGETIKIPKNKFENTKIGFHKRGFLLRSKAFLRYVLPYPQKMYNYFGLKTSLLLKKADHRFYPVKLGVETTNKCNLHCPLCLRGRGKLNRPEGIMSFINYKKVIDKLSPYLFHVRLHGWGEPFLNPDLMKMVHYAHSKGIYTNFHTNGHFLTEKNIEAMIDAGLDEVNIALDGMSQETYHKFRVGGNMKTVCNGVKKFCEIKKKRQLKYPLINLQFLVMAHNEHEIPLIKKFAHLAGVDHLVLKSVNLVFIEDKEVLDYLPKNGKNTRYSIEDNKLKFRKEKSCTCVFMEIKLNWDGTISVCVWDDTHGGYISRNLFTESIDGIIFGKEYAEARKKSINKSFGMCLKCEGEKSSV